VRRPLTIGAVVVAAVLLTVLAPLWVPVTVIVDVVRRRRHLPLVRLGTFAWCWSLLEIAGVVASGALWVVGQGRNRRLHYRLQRWWAAHLIGALCATTGLRIEVEGADVLGDGPLICLGRHASLGDALVSAWVFGSWAGRTPRYVMKRELLADPCLDIVGQRVPNYFVDRSNPVADTEVAGIAAMAEGLGDGDVAVIFPEGTRASTAKRAARLEQLAERSPARHRRLAGLTHVLPPRPAGAAGLLAKVPDADVVVLWHVGFDGLDTFPRIIAALAHGAPRARVVLERHDRSSVPDGDDFIGWLDDRWVEMDGRVRAASLGLQSGSALP
jgi:1-acyl-sn-glycerol-3-phosphate acyltransferase